MSNREYSMKARQSGSGVVRLIARAICIIGSAIKLTEDIGEGGHVIVISCAGAAWLLLAASAVRWVKVMAYRLL